MQKLRHGMSGIEREENCELPQLFHLFLPPPLFFCSDPGNQIQSFVHVRLTVYHLQIHVLYLKMQRHGSRKSNRLMKYLPIKGKMVYLYSRFKNLIA